MWRGALCYSLLFRSAFHNTRMPPARSTGRLFASGSATVDTTLLAQEWSTRLLQQCPPDNTKSSSALQTEQIVKAASRTLPLLQETASVPFVCRYRTDVIHPLTTEQVHLLSEWSGKHQALASLRQRLLDALPPEITSSDSAANKEWLRKIQASTSKHELEDWYAPYKPPSKGSIAERIQKEHPHLVTIIDQLWDHGVFPKRQQQQSALQPHEAVIHLLAAKIAADPNTIDVVLENLYRYARIELKVLEDTENKYTTYYDFSGHLASLRDHQVLAIRRGVQQKALKMAYAIDGDRMEAAIRGKLLASASSLVSQHPTTADKFRRDSFWRPLFSEAIHDAWSRLLRRRGTSRIWAEKCKAAEERAMQVFEQNLKSALLAPPLVPSSYLLAMDPGFQAGIKCAVLDPDGNVEGKLETVQFLGASKREKAIEQLGNLLDGIHSKTSGSVSSKEDRIKVALGNGHGSQEGRSLIQDASVSVGVPIDVRLVNEAGASVWSVTPQAKTEFPKDPPAAIAAISIGRRLQNPLHELVKVPPRSLGLGMYQHDLSEKDLDQKLHLASVDAVATVGVDANNCSLEILQKVPGLQKLASKIIKARPLEQRQDLLKVSGLGPKTYENAAAFVRVQNGPEPLDATLVHPESYELARYLLKKLHWKKLSCVPKDLPPRSQWETEWSSIFNKAAKKFSVSSERALAVTENLVDSMTQKDPRLVAAAATKQPSAGSVNGCSPLTPEQMENLEKLCPVRNIIGPIRSVTDFGAFVDFGGHNDGLIHISKLGPVRLESLLIGQEVGVDILAVDANHKVSLGLSGLGLEADAGRLGRTPKVGQRTKGSKRGMSTVARGGASGQTTKRKGSSKGLASSSSKTKNPAKRRKTFKA